MSLSWWYSTCFWCAFKWRWHQRIELEKNFKRASEKVLKTVYYKKKLKNYRIFKKKLTFISDSQKKLLNYKKKLSGFSKKLFDSKCFKSSWDKTFVMKFKKRQNFLKAQFEKLLYLENFLKLKLFFFYFSKIFSFLKAFLKLKTFSITIARFNQLKCYLCCPFFGIWMSLLKQFLKLFLFLFFKQKFHQTQIKCPSNNLSSVPAAHRKCCATSARVISRDLTITVSTLISCAKSHQALRPRIFWLAKLIF